MTNVRRFCPIRIRALSANRFHADRNPDMRPFSFVCMISILMVSAQDYDEVTGDDFVAINEVGWPLQFRKMSLIHI